MPVYLFTIHAYRSWMPDRPQGYVRRREGILPTDRIMAAKYARVASETVIEFDDEVQRALIDETLTASKTQDLRCHDIATDATHVHLLVSWTTEKNSAAVRKSLKTSLTQRLNRDFQKRTWFSRSGSRKPVKDQSHFDYLIQTYLPDHSGWKWSESTGLFQ